MLPPAQPVSRRARVMRMIGRVALGAYLVALAASTGYRLLRSKPQPVAGFNEHFMQVPEFAGDAPTGRTIRLAYFDYAPPGKPDAPVVVLLHGSPGGATGFAGLMPSLSGNCPPPGTLGGGFTRRPIVCPNPLPAHAVRVIAPYLPGFGDSENTITDYSFRAHAQYLRAMLDQLGVKRAHIIGYSMGGGPAFNLEDIDPARVASITLLSSLGVQEFELMGDYHLNHITHGMQFVPLWFIEDLLPDFGAFDASPGVEYALNFYQSDQRPLRPWMLRYDKPLLVMQGLQDAQVPPEAAFEHARIVPQAELITFADGGHGMVFNTPTELAPPLLDFVARVEAGVAPTRAGATPQRVADALVPVQLVPMVGVALFSYYALLIVFAALKPEFGAAAVGAFLAAGRAPLFGSLIASSLGVLLGDLIVRSVMRGRSQRYGVDAAAHLPWRFVMARASVDASVRAFERGVGQGMLRRFVLGARSATYLGGASVLRGARAALAQLGCMVGGACIWSAVAVTLASVIAWPFVRAFPSWPLPVVLLTGLVLLALAIVLRSLAGRTAAFDAPQRREATAP
jgi:pimeloyl-ACP methyl ester carboxylesterase